MEITDKHNKFLELLDNASINNLDIVFCLRKKKYNQLKEVYWLIDYRKF